MNGVNIVDTSAPDGLAIEGNDDDIDPEEDEDLAERLRNGIPKDADIRNHTFILFFNQSFSCSFCSVRRIHFDEESLRWIDFYHSFGKKVQF